MNLTSRLIKCFMNWTFEKVADPEHIWIVTSGFYTADDFLQLLTEMIALPYWKLGRDVLWDNRNIDLSITPPNELVRSAGNFVRLNGELAFTRIAVLYTCEKSMETAERFGLITDGRSTASVRRFRDEEQALGWLCPQYALVA